MIRMARVDLVPVLILWSTLRTTFISERGTGLDYFYLSVKTMH